MVVYTYGVFDLLHTGHLKSFKRILNIFGIMKEDLIIGVFSDEVATSFKRKPILNERERMEILEELGYRVIVQRELDPQKNIKKLNRFNNKIIVAKGRGAGFENYKRKDYCLMPYNTGISTSEIINRIKNDNTK